MKTHHPVELCGGEEGDQINYAAKLGMWTICLQSSEHRRSGASAKAAESLPPEFLWRKSTRETSISKFTRLRAKITKNTSKTPCGGYQKITFS